MKTQIVYALIASEHDLFIEEVWASIYSLRLYEPDREVRVCCDAPTAERINLFPELKKLITEVVIIPIPEDCKSAKLRSRQVKTTIRQYIDGKYLFVDTDTVFCGSLEYLDNLSCDIAAVKEYHLPLSKSPFKHIVISNIRDVFNVDVTQDDGWHNSGVIYVADNEISHEFYRQWNTNWRYSALKKNMSQDEPALMKTDKDLGYVINELPDKFNCQPAMSVKYLADAKIIHFLHMYFPKDQSFCPFIDKSFYQRMHNVGEITEDLAHEIRYVKQSFSSPSCIVGWKTMIFMASPVFQVFENIYNDGGVASWLMLKTAGLLEKIHKISRKDK